MIPWGAPALYARSNIFRTSSSEYLANLLASISAVLFPEGGAVFFVWLLADFHQFM
jgi:hypothetical protein